MGIDDNGTTDNELDLSAAMNDIAAGMGFDEPPETGDDTSDDVKLDSSAADVADESAAVSEGSEAPTPPAESGVPVPKTWRADAASKWAQLPPEVQAEVVKREEDIFRGLETYKADAGFGKSMQSVLDPYMPTLKQHGIDPVQQVAGLMNAHFTLATGTAEQKQALFAKLAQDYGVQLGGDAPYVDPAVAALQSQLQSLQSQLQGRERQESAQHQQKLRSEIDSFAADPAHAYFDEVASDIAGLLKSGTAKDLADAYEKAVWANPVTRAKEQSRLTTEAVSKAQKDAAERAQAAKRAAAANVRSSSKPASGTAPLGSIDDTLSAALADLKTRG